MKAVLYNYDIFPKVFLGDREQSITVQPLGRHSAFESGHVYTVKISKLTESRNRVYPERQAPVCIELTPDADGCLHFSAFFAGEGEFHINIYNESEDKQPRLTMSVYSLYEDMAGRLPQRGDLHMHTCCSDGKEGPETVVANYRGHGYDFIVISDHHRYYPSIEARDFFDGVADITVVPGEEVHLPLNDVHYVNFGGTYSINALVTPSKNEEKDGDSLEYRSICGKAPDTMTKEEFIEMITERSASVPREHESERLSFAVMQWVYEQVQAAGGLGIFPHPYWQCPTLQLPEDYTEFIYREGPFDAFEVLGGENYYAHNGFQAGLYYKMKAEGIDYPVVGSTDSHGSTEHNRNSRICSTIVFAKENTREGLISAIKDKYSIAVDTISAEYRLVGDFRLMKYASFLMENYYPIHDLVCRSEGYYMNRYIVGDEQAAAVLKAMKGQLPALQKKYFAL